MRVRMHPDELWMMWMRRCAARRRLPGGWPGRGRGPLVVEAGAAAVAPRGGAVGAAAAGSRCSAQLQHGCAAPQRTRPARRALPGHLAGVPGFARPCLLVCTIGTA